MKLRPLPQSVTLGLIAGLLLSPSLTSAAENDYEMASRLIQLPQKLSLTAKGGITVDKSKWKLEKDSDGTELFIARKGPESRAAAMKTADGGVEAFTAYTLKATPEKPESATSLFFAKGKLVAYSTCEDEGGKDSIGRICVTATPRLCQGLRNGEGVDGEVMKEMEQFEMRGLASILTLRGSDHQLDNVVRSGNRLGLKTALQTTKGQLIALAKQVAKEVAAKDAAKAPAKDKPPEVADKPQPAAPVDAKAEERAKADNLLAKNVLEKTFPRLKQACQETKF